MSRRYRLSLFSLFSLVVFIALTGCGSGGSITTPAPEGFTNANLNGTYAFTATGNNGAFFSLAGSLQANGSGSISGGTVDINSPVSSLVGNTSVGGTYTVNSDGRTVINVTTPLGNFTLEAVLLSNSNGLVIRFDNAAAASGSLDMQTSSAFSTAALAGSFAFNLSGIDAGDGPEATVGAFTFDNTGNISTGIQDLNDNGAVLAATGITGGTVTSPTSGRGTITLDTSSGVRDFAFYVIDANHIKMVSSDTFLPALSGDAFRQPASFTNSSTLPAGSFAFTLAGASGGVPFVAGAIITADGNGNITSGTEDVNLNGTLNQNISVAGTYTVAATGRGTLNLSGSGQSFAIYPTMTGGLQMLDLGAIDGGVALQQQGSSFSNSTINGTYGLNFTGVNLNLGTEVDAVAQFTANGNGTFTGAFDFNDEGSLSFSLALNGTDTISSNGRGTGSISSSAGQFSMIYYVVSSSRVLFIEADGAQPSVGVFATQTE